MIWILSGKYRCHTGHLEDVVANSYSYNPIFMNDAMYNQDVYRSYGPENHDRLKKTQRQYDPEAFLSGGRQKGWKL